MQNLKSSSHYISDEQFSANWMLDIDAELTGIFFTKKSSGSYEFQIKIFADFEEVVFKASTNDSQLFDAWTSAKMDDYQDGEDGFENWDHVIESTFRLFDLDALAIHNSMNNK